MKRLFLFSLLTLICLNSFLISSSARAQKSVLVERVEEVETKETNPLQARTVLLNAAAEKASEDLIKEIIGEAKFSRNRALIQNKIMRRSAAYLPFSKAGELKPLETGFSMAVTIQANVDSLQKLLLENGLFYDADSTPSVLPVVRFLDREHAKSFAWWTGPTDPSKVFLAKESRALENALHEAFLKSGFSFTRPQTLHDSDLLPGGAREEAVSGDEVATWAQAWNSQVVLQGQVATSKGERSDTTSIEIRLTALQVSNGRVVAEVGRTFETDAGVFETVVDRKLHEAFQTLPNDLASQVLEAWKQGTINSQLYQLKVTGGISLPVQEGLKDALKARAREIKTVRERSIANNEVIYEVDSSSVPSELAKKMDGLEVLGTKFGVERSSEKDLVLRVLR